MFHTIATHKPAIVKGLNPIPSQRLANRGARHSHQTAEQYDVEH